MRLKEFYFKNLFGQYDPHVKFFTGKDGEPNNSVTILHGPNGVGKTTVLQAIEGLLSLDFNLFRSIPFDECCLTFSDDRKILVRPSTFSCPHMLQVDFDGYGALLNDKRSGPVERNQECIEKVEALRKAFYEATEGVLFELINTNRTSQKTFKLKNRDGIRQTYILKTSGFGDVVETVSESDGYVKSKPEQERMFLANKVYNFINEAQIDSEMYFSASGSNAFERILESLMNKNEIHYDRQVLLDRMSCIKKSDDFDRELGLSVDLWDYEKLSAQLQEDKQNVDMRIYTVVSAYLDVLEARVAMRKKVANRLYKFQETLCNFFSGKTIRIDPKKGFVIRSVKDQELGEDQLSSGEYHLLYLFVAALTVKRRGTVIAIDEPELSMHISWSRNLIRNLIECASGAETQFVFATHSPEIVAEFRSSLQLMS